MITYIVDINEDPKKYSHRNKGIFIVVGEGNADKWLKFDNVYFAMDLNEAHELYERIKR